jgi:hypothetical protein
MDLNNVYIVDCEFDGFLDVLTKMHVMSVRYKTANGWATKSTNKYEDVKKVFEDPNNTVVGHNFITFDQPGLEKVFPELQVKATIIDTLPLSQYLYPKRIKHSLESWAEDIEGVKKVEMTDWENLSYEEYVERCEADTVINQVIWEDFYQYLKEIYETNTKGLEGVIGLGNFIREVLRCQEENPIKLDVEQCKKNLEYLEGIIEEKSKELVKIMPKIPQITKKKKPKNPYKKDGTLSELGKKWFYMLKELDLPDEYDGEIDVIRGYGEPNPSSTEQVKDFLFSKGWKPKLFKDGANGKVPQLRDDDKNLCKSITVLFKDYPELEALEGMSVAQHRAGYLKAFLETMNEEGYVTARFSSIAKTWRVKHIKPIVNLPANNSEHGNLVRKVLIAPEGKLFVNFDLDSLEDRTKRSCIIDIDPEYVREMSDPSYDPHLAIGVEAGLLSKEESDFFKWHKNKKRKEEDCPKIFKQYSEEERLEQFERLSKVRSSAKTTNYAATYSASAKKIAETAGISLNLGKKLHSAYWSKNKSVKIFTDSLEVKTIRGLNWIYSPYTNMWLYLSADHIKFSAVNQNFGSKIHFTLLYFMMKDYGYKIIKNIHDEASLYIDDTQEAKDKLNKDLKDCINRVNKIFNYGVEFGSSAEFAKSYGDVH